MPENSVFIEGNFVNYSVNRIFLRGACVFTGTTPVSGPFTHFFGKNCESPGKSGMEVA